MSQEKKKRDDSFKTWKMDCLKNDACHYVAKEKEEGHISNKYDMDTNIERIFKRQNDFEKRLDRIEERLDGSLTDYSARGNRRNRVARRTGRRRGGRRTRGKSRRKKRRRKKTRRKRKKRRRKKTRKRRRRTRRKG